MERARPNQERVREAMREVSDAETPEPDQVEPAGDQDPEVEKEYDEAKEEAAEEAASHVQSPESSLQEERDRYLDLAQRTQAEFENFRKRAAREAGQAGERAKANLVRELLPVVDNLERALATANPGEDHLADGVRLVHAELVSTLERNGITPFDPSGEPFDPALHEALSTRPGENGSGVVLDVVEKGYKLGDAILRPARVVVSA
jgi:molecular chaperone GrpE